MTPAWYVFMALMLSTAAAIIVAVVMITLFLNRNKGTRSLLNPIDGTILYSGLVRPNAFGPEAEPGRRRVLCALGIAFGLFGLGLLVFVLLPVIPA